MLQKLMSLVLDRPNPSKQHYRTMRVREDQYDLVEKFLHDWNTFQVQVQEVDRKEEDFLYNLPGMQRLLSTIDHRFGWK